MIKNSNEIFLFSYIMVALATITMKEIRNSQKKNKWICFEQW